MNGSSPDRVFLLFGHRVTAPTDLSGLPSDNLDTLLSYLRRRFDVLHIHEAAARLRGEATGKRSGIVLTFDDGYADNYHRLLPALRAHNVPATIFVTTSALDTRERLWFEEVRRCIHETQAEAVHADFLPEPLPLKTPQQRANAADATVARLKATRARPSDAVPDLRRSLNVPERPCDDGKRMLSRAELAALATEPLITIGAHTVTHPMLSHLPIDEARYEIAQSRATIAEITGKQPDFFAYPNGQPEDFTPAIASYLASEGWLGAVTTVPQVAQTGCDLYWIPRLPIETGVTHRIAWSMLKSF